MMKDIVSAFNRIVNAEKGHIDMVVTSAVALSPSKLSELKSNVTSQFLPAGAQVNVIEKVDASIGGGYIVEFDGRLLDSSVVSRTKEIKRVTAKTIAEATAAPMPPPATRGISDLLALIEAQKANKN